VLAIIGELDHYTPPADVADLEGAGAVVGVRPSTVAHAPYAPTAEHGFAHAHAWLRGD
jgi:hypothetical protein